MYKIHSKDDEKIELIKSLYSIYGNFKNTSLYINGASSIVFGEGSLDSKVMFIGEAPGADEDIQGRPFVGRSGRFLTRIIEECGITRSEIFITNIVKCRPPNNRTPSTIEINKGLKHILQYEIDIVNPAIIAPLGASALRSLIPEATSISSMRGKAFETKYGTVFPIYHPAYVLRNPHAKDTFVNDIKKSLFM
jgi:uracil-DNA glycosylase